MHILAGLMNNQMSLQLPDELPSFKVSAAGTTSWLDPDHFLPAGAGDHPASIPHQNSSKSPASATLSISKERRLVERRENVDDLLLPSDPHSI